MKGAGTAIDQFVIFRLQDEECGINIQRISTIEKVMPITRVPKTPGFIKGVINLRGEIIPVMSLRERFNMEAVENNDETRIIIVKFNEIQVGMIVDTVEEVIYLNEESTESISNLSNDISMDYILGVGKVDNRIITLLNVEKLVNISAKEQ